MEIISNILAVAITSVGLIGSSPLGPSKLPHSDYRSLLSASEPAQAVSMSLSTGEEIGSFFTRGPTRAPLEQIPGAFINAIIAIEDRRFLQHEGVDPVGLARAAMSQLTKSPRGGSSIDQQLAKNAWTGSGLTIDRKINEAILALRGRRILGEAGVMQAYIENVWFGRGMTGAAGAPRAWFNKDWADLTLGEVAYLAALLKGPAYFDAYKYPDRAKARRDLVIRSMEREEMISSEQAQAAIGEELVVVPPSSVTEDIDKAWISAAAKHFLNKDDTISGRLISNEAVELSIDMEWQAIAQKVLSDHVDRTGGKVALGTLGEGQLRLLGGSDAASEGVQDILRGALRDALPWNSPLTAMVVQEAESQTVRLMDINGQTGSYTIADGSLDVTAGDIIGVEMITESSDRETSGEVRLHGRTVVEGAVVVMDPRNGAILATVGGVDPALSGFDRTRALRQPGSAIKSFLWLAALDAGYGLETPVPDLEQTYFIDGVEWTPRNYNGGQSGMVSLRAAFEQSSNLVAASLIHALSPEAMARMAQRAGAYPGGMRPHPTAALGSIETTLLDLTSGYATLINDGVYRAPSMIRSKTVDGEARVRDGITVGVGRMGAGPVASRYALEDIITMMDGVTARGTAAVAFRNHPVEMIGKTGTTQNYRDGWFVGLTPHVAIGVWIGRDDNRPMSAAQAGGRAAAPVAADIMREALGAGLVDANGYRDTRMTSGLPWPPGSAAAPPEGGTIIWTDSVRLQPQAQPQNRRPVPQDPFWRGQVQEADPFAIPDRNRHLRSPSWN